MERPLLAAALLFVVVLSLPVLLFSFAAIPGSLLVARLGPDNVLQALPQADYRPEIANTWVPVQQKVRESVRCAQMPARPIL